MKVNGISHIHTVLTDGKMGLDEIVRISKEKGIGFILVTEHAEQISSEQYQDLVLSCDKASDKDILVIPGLEYSNPDYVHILAIGVTEHPGDIGLDQQIKSIKMLGGISVLAHANACVKVPYDELKDIDGVEAWNTRYRARHLPRTKAINVLDKMRMKSGRNIPAFSGLDLHLTEEFGTLRIIANVQELSKEEIFRSLRSGDFVNENKNFRLGAFENPGIFKRILLRSLDLAYWITWTFK